jgi:hypothetical protein
MDNPGQFINAYLFFSRRESHARTHRILIAGYAVSFNLARVSESLFLKTNHEYISDLQSSNLLTWGQFPPTMRTLKCFGYHVGWHFDGGTA